MGPILPKYSNWDLLLYPHTGTLPRSVIPRNRKENRRATPSDRAQNLSHALQEEVAHYSRRAAAVGVLLLTS